MLYPCFLPTAEREAFDRTPAEYNLPFNDVAFSTRGIDITLKGWHIPVAKYVPTTISVHGLGSSRAGDEAVGLASRLWAEESNTLLSDLRGLWTSGDGKVSGGYFEQNDLLGADDFLIGRGVPPDSNGFSMRAATSVHGISQEPGIRALFVNRPFANASDLIVQEVARRTPVPKWLVPLFGPGTKLATDVPRDIKFGGIGREFVATGIDYPILLIHGMEDERIPMEQGSSIWLVPDTTTLTLP